MLEIGSTKNTLIKQIKKLEKKKYRDEFGLYKLEGFHLIEEALASEVVIEALLVTSQTEKELSRFSAVATDKTYRVADDVFKTISSVPAPQGILALVKLNQEFLPNEIKGPLLLLDNVQDPGNVGTMIRTADAANFKGVILGEGSADIYNDKVVRSMQGSQFHLTIIRGELAEIVPQLKESKLTIYGTELNKDAVDYRTIKKQTEFALIMGNEGQGVKSELLQLADKNLYIPILGKAESLNVAVAAGILMFSLN